MLILLIWASTWPNTVQYTMLLHTELQSIMPKIDDDDLGPVSISNKTSYHKISWSLKVARLVVWIIASLWNLTGTLAALLLRCLSNFRAIDNFKYKSCGFRNFAKSYDNNSYRILKLVTPEVRASAGSHLNSQKTLHILPWQARYAVSIVSILE